MWVLAGLDGSGRVGRVRLVFGFIDTPEAFADLESEELGQEVLHIGFDVQVTGSTWRGSLGPSPSKNAHIYFDQHLRETDASFGSISALRAYCSSISELELMNID
ncbi:hypothetical protein Tco_0286920 [Tanacetum coccineum]